MSSSSNVFVDCPSQRMFASSVVLHCRLPSVDQNVCVCVVVLRSFVVIMLSLLNP